MVWQGVYGHDDVVEQFRRAVGRGRLGSSFLLVGPEGIGKRRFAIGLARALLCRCRPEEALEPCGQCPACTQVMALTHPDLELVSKPADKSFLPLELLIGDTEHRMRRGLCHRLAMKPMMGGRKVAVVDDADYLNAEGANCLLKTLEEPPPRSVLMLLGTSAAKQLPTIRSRCQIVRFRPLEADAVERILIEQALVGDAIQARRLAGRCGGSVRRAMELADPEWWTFRDLLLDHLRASVLDAGRLAAAAMALVDQAGKDTSARRRRMRQVIGSAAEFYRLLVRRLSGSEPAEAKELSRWIEPAAGAWRCDAATAAACAERCLDALEHVDRNANPTTLVESWLDGLAEIATPLRPARRAP